MITPVIEEISAELCAEIIFETIKDRPYSFFLDSACGCQRLGRFSFLGCDPFLVFKCRQDDIALEWPDGRTENFNANPFLALKSILKRYAVVRNREGLPFTCGAVGYFGYGLKNFVEDLPDNPADDLRIPDSALGFYDTVVICDNLSGKRYIASSGLPETDPVRNIRRQKERIEEFKYRLFSSAGSAFGETSPRSGGPEPGEKGFAEIPSPRLKSNFSGASYMKAVEKAKNYIRKGDIYQVNLSQRFEAELDMTPFELYSRLRRLSPAPFSAYLDFKDAVIASSSPERFLLKKRDYVETRPIKGTRPRGKDALDDLLMEKELIASPKDRAEHIMIVDLERNDLGRICRYDSVRVVESVILEKYANVFHLVSTVAGRLKKGIDPIDCFLAAFPGGSITGAPKIRAMEIIDELEPVRRSVYTGAIGYISFDGGMDTSIVIRTFIIKGRTAYFQVGGGIVADSDPEKEYEETLDKAKGLMLALGGSARVMGSSCSKFPLPFRGEGKGEGMALGPTREE
ncbi:MAG: aminodeoxychorismate synthase component I [Candidatus Omnitrophota bacterium]|nr:aminodeoxychorismate synthase component I [Candidatus Omnitrophota bacterium]